MKIVSRIFVVCLAVAIAVGSFMVMRSHSRASQLRAIDIAMASGDLEKAELIAKDLLESRPTDHQALHAMSLVLMRKGDFEEAISTYHRIPNESREDEVQFNIARYLKQAGSLDEAERELTSLLSRSPDHINGNLELARLLRFQGRNWELQEPFRRLVSNRVFSLEEFLFAMGAPGRFWFDGIDQQNLAKAAEATPNSHVVKLTKARDLMRKQDGLQPARELLESIVKQDSEHLAAQMMLGAILIDQGDDTSFRIWHGKLPQDAEEHASLWNLRALYFQKLGNNQLAAACSWECLKRDANDKSSHYLLAQLLPLLNRAPAAEKFKQRFENLSAFQELVQYGNGQGGFPPPHTIKKFAALAVELGRYWEAMAWCAAALGQDQSLQWPSETARTLKDKLSNDAPLTLATHDLAKSIDLSDLFIDDWKQLIDGRQQKSPVDLPSDKYPMAVFRNVASEVGIDFEFVNGNIPKSRTAGMYEFSGGAIAVIDYDGDLSPDIYLTQGRKRPLFRDAELESQFRDRLFRNLGNGQFEDVTMQAGLGDTQYSQGATVGDFNNDGFPDLFVSNIGSNRLYHNNGDGTFSEIDMPPSPTDDEWSIAAAFADLNGDSLPDLYVVNYLSGDVFERDCFIGEQAIQCKPTMFPAAQDRLYRNNGDGSFDDITGDSGIDVPDGKGMGLVAADFDDDGMLEIFIANDTTANFFFDNESEYETEVSTVKTIKLSNIAMLCGLGVGELGQTQSCMGIATADSNGNGTLELFVTNFVVEANNLYSLAADDSYEDIARRKSLQAPGYHMMGWGTQFLDGELDGYPDLVVANGHLEAHRNEELMNTQYFRNNADGGFVELSLDGESYFNNKALGRGVAVLDFNSDGLPDFGVTHVDAPFALLRNESSKHGHFISLRLRGTKSSRDAVGCKVTVVAGKQTWMKQIKAGDGFSASNERVLIFGLGAISEVDKVNVSWPSGMKASFDFKSRSCDSHWIIVEGRQQPVQIR